MPKPGLPGPLFLHFEGLSKGQVWLNNRATGRYWDIGPQKALYLPEPWWRAKNRLVVFDEAGQSPRNIYLARDKRMPIYMTRV